MVFQRKAGRPRYNKECTDISKWCQASDPLEVKLMRRTETLVDPILCTVNDLLDSPFGEPPPTTIHLTSLLDRTTDILKDIDEVSKSGQGWEPIVVWEPYYVCLNIGLPADR